MDGADVLDDAALESRDELGAVNDTGGAFYEPAGDTEEPLTDSERQRPRQAGRMVERRLSYVQRVDDARQRKIGDGQRTALRDLLDPDLSGQRQAQALEQWIVASIQRRRGRVAPSGIEECVVAKRDELLKIAEVVSQAGHVSFVDSDTSELRPCPMLGDATADVRHQRWLAVPMAAGCRPSEASTQRPCRGRAGRVGASTPSGRFSRSPLLDGLAPVSEPLGRGDRHAELADGQVLDANVTLVARS